MPAMITLLTALALIFPIQRNEKDETTAELLTAFCVLTDEPHKDSSPGELKIWFGQRLSVLCAFYAGPEPIDKNINSISAGCRIRNEGNRSFFHCYNAAFLDENANLIACGGGKLDFGDPIKPTGELTHFTTMLLPIPEGVHDSIVAYKLASYESTARIGTLKCDYTKIRTTDRPFTGQRASNDESKSAISTTFPVRVGSRQLWNVPEQNWKAESIEGFFSFDPTLSSDVTQLEVTAKVHLDFEVNCDIKSGTNNAIRPWVRFNNPTDKNLYGQLYLAFFDKDGNLLGSIDWNADVKARSTNPALSINDKLVPNADAKSGTMPMPLPLGFEKKVASYKMTVYTSDKPIGMMKK